MVDAKRKNIRQHCKQSYDDHKEISAGSMKAADTMKGGKAEAMKKRMNPGDIDHIADFTAPLAKKRPEAEKNAEPVVDFLGDAAAVLE